jgi:hypothetical protein
LPDSTVGMKDQIFYLVLQKGGAVYERVTKEKLENGLATGEIGERTVSNWVIEDGKLVFSDKAKEYFRK